MAKRTRREFLESAVLGAAGAGVALTAFRPESLLAEPQINADGRGYTAGKFALEVGGVPAGWMQSAEGGRATSDVVTEKTGNVPVQKHIAGVKYEDITLNCGAGMSKAFYDWIIATMDRKHERKDGAVLACNYDSKVLTRLEWYNGLITEIGFPAVDAASKDAAKMTIKIHPEFTRVVKGSGSASAKLQTAQKEWTQRNFRLQISGLDCTRVNKIEALTVKQKVVENPVGELRAYEKEPAHLELPNLAISLPEGNAAGFQKWHEDFVIKGNNAGNTKNGQLEYLTPDLRQVLFTLTFSNLGIFKITPEKAEAGSENIRRVKVEMYCEDIKFAYGAATWA